MRRLALAAALAWAGTAVAAAPAPITGRWLTVDGQAMVEVAPCSGGAALCGRIVRILKPRGPGPVVDANNPDKALRSRPVEGLTILSGFRPSGDRWKGQIYDPESGRTYRSELARDAGTLKVKGCWGPFCRTQEWSQAR